MARFQYQAYVEPIDFSIPIVHNTNWYPEYPDKIEVNKREQPFHLAFVSIVQNVTSVDIWHAEYPDFAKRRDFKQERTRSHIERFEVPVVTIDYWHPEFPDHFKDKTDRRRDGIFTRSFDTTAFVPVVNYDGLIKITNIQVTLAVKKEVDGGQGTADAGDVSGTIFTFNKTFKDIDSIVVTVNSVVERIAVVDFVDAPNPTSFKVYVFDASGVRQTELIRWVARGIT